VIKTSALVGIKLMLIFYYIKGGKYEQAKTNNSNRDSSFGWTSRIGIKKF
jgi:hypothetical protein